MKNKTAQKITGQLYFPVKSKATCKNAAHLDTKKATKVTWVTNAGALDLLFSLSTQIRGFGLFYIMLKQLTYVLFSDTKLPL